SLETETEPEPGVDPTALEFLASDAAGRAHRLLVEALAAGGLAGGASPGGAPDVRTAVGGAPPGGARDV
ncbi:SWF or SNF family helicase, partial [Streptomyces sp. SID6041]|nr:SWF or SNF family helicase [Streptomyces sp. SID6041]